MEFYVVLGGNICFVKKLLSVNADINKATSQKAKTLGNVLDVTKFFKWNYFSSR